MIQNGAGTYDVPYLVHYLEGLAKELTQGDPEAAAVLIRSARCISDGSTWISVKDRVPMGEGQVLAVNSVGFMACVTTIYKNTDGKYDGEDATPEETTEPIGDITHWMPLPEAPK